MKNKLKLFKAYCLVAGKLHKYGYPFLDDNGVLAVKTLGGKIYSGTEIAYQHSSRLDLRAGKPHWYYDFVGKLVGVSAATCGYTEKCQVGKHNTDCDDGMYSPQKCAVVFLDGKFDLNKMRYSMSFEEMEKLYKMAS